MTQPAGQSEIIPVLMTPSDLGALSGAAGYHHMFYVDELAPVLETKRQAGEDAVSTAVGLLLTECAVTLVHVDVTRQRASFIPDDEGALVYDFSKNRAIGFNDHDGGSESDFKILLNGSPTEPDMQYVLYSPPDADGNPTNTTFHRADFVFVSDEPMGTYEISGYVPNPLKTGSAYQYKGRSGYQYFLFGGPDMPQLVYEGFIRAGFDFSTDPYSREFDAPEGQVTTFSLGALERAAAKRLGYRGMHYWPGDQFAAQVRNLGLEVPKFDPLDYPLVKPENSL